MAKVFGTLQTPLKPPTYKGGVTDEIKVSINENNLITAELTDSIKDYIASVRSYATLLADGLTHEIEEQVEKLEAVITELRVDAYSDLYRLEQSLNNQSASIQAELANKFSTVSSNLDSEIIRAKDSESDLLNQIKALNAALLNEINRAELSESTIQDNVDNNLIEINNLSSDLAEEISRATEAELDLQNNLNTLESTLTSSIDTESTRAQAAEAELQEQITNQAESFNLLIEGSDPEIIDGIKDLISYVNQNGPEIIKIKSDITNLEDRLSDEHKGRLDAENALDDKIDEEISIREQEIQSLTDLINSFHPLQFTSGITLSNSLAHYYSLPTITARWTLNREPNSITVNGNPIQGTKAQNSASISYAYDWIDVKRDSPELVVVADNITKKVTLTFTHYIYYGVGGEETAVSSLNKQPSTKSGIGDITVNVGEDEYFWYAIPDEPGYAEPVFKVGGFEGGMEELDKEQFGYVDYQTGRSPYFVTYKIYRSTNPNLGKTTFNIS